MTNAQIGWMLWKKMEKSTKPTPLANHSFPLCKYEAMNLANGDCVSKCRRGQAVRVSGRGARGTCVGVRLSDSSLSTTACHRCSRCGHVCEQDTARSICKWNIKYFNNMHIYICHSHTCNCLSINCLQTRQKKAHIWYNFWGKLVKFQD